MEGNTNFRCTFLTAVRPIAESLVPEVQGLLDTLGRDRCLSDSARDGYKCSRVHNEPVEDISTTRLLEFYKIKVVEITVHNGQVQNISTARGVYTEELLCTEYIIR